VSEGVVERLEVVEVDEQQSAMPVPARARRQRLAQTVVQQTTVGQAGQGVVEGEMPNFFLGRFAHGDIGQR
jgi:hypothetical protein